MGIYRLVVTSYKPGETGKYTLTVNEVTNAEPDRIVKGELKTTDPAERGIFYMLHKVHLVADRPYVFELDSPRFDSYLLLFDPTGKQRLARNDNAGEFVSSSRIDFTPREAGTYLLVVRSYSAGKTGPYTLRTQQFEPAAPSARRPGAKNE